MTRISLTAAKALDALSYFHFSDIHRRSINIECPLEGYQSYEYFEYTYCPVPRPVLTQSSSN